MTKIVESKMLLGTFLHKCTVLAQVDITADAAAGKATAGCRCCTACDPASTCLPP